MSHEYVLESGDMGYNDVRVESHILFMIDASMVDL